MRRTVVRGVGGAAFAAALTLGLAGAAQADDEPLSIDDLPSISDAEVDVLRTAIDVPDIRGIDIPEIRAFEPEVTTEGADTVVSLDTDVLFEFGKADLSDDAQAAVSEAVAGVPDGAQIRVEGHTDSIGSDADNLALSKERAEAVAKAIEAERDDLEVAATGKGEKEPVAPNTKGNDDNPEGREKNRRVEIRYAD